MRVLLNSCHSPAKALSHLDGFIIRSRCLPQNLPVGYGQCHYVYILSVVFQPQPQHLRQPGPLGPVDAASQCSCMRFRLGVHSLPVVLSRRTGRHPSCPALVSAM